MSALADLRQKAAKAIEPGGNQTGWLDQQLASIRNKDAAGQAEQTFRWAFALIALIVMLPYALSHLSILVLGLAAAGLVIAKRYGLAAVVAGVVGVLAIIGWVLNALTGSGFLLLPVVVPLALALALAARKPRMELLAPLAVLAVVMYATAQLPSAVTNPVISSGFVWLIAAIVLYKVVQLSKGITFSEVVIVVSVLAMEFLTVWLIGKEIIPDSRAEFLSLYVYWDVAVAIVALFGLAYVTAQQSGGTEASEKPEAVSEQERNERLYQLRSRVGEDVLTPDGKHLREEALRTIGVPVPERKSLSEDGSAADSYKSHGREQQLAKRLEEIANGQRPAKLDDSWDANVVNPRDAELMKEFGVTVEEIWRMQDGDPQKTDQVLDGLHPEEEAVLGRRGQWNAAEALRVSSLSKRELDWLGVNRDALIKHSGGEYREKYRRVQDDPAVSDDQKPAVWNQRSKHWVLNRPLIESYGDDPRRLEEIFGLTADDFI